MAPLYRRQMISAARMSRRPDDREHDDDLAAGSHRKLLAKLAVIGLAHRGHVMLRERCAE
ncbi:hypothetical protein [Bradyrhizobium sp. DASA03120]|uniref:hypothetical protein n=1 Tax=Bradyrhizobium sp. SMVTL-02 TaxID=3395917 RepID=UPI003F6F54DC